MTWVIKGMILSFVHCGQHCHETAEALRSFTVVKKGRQVNNGRKKEVACSMQIGNCKT